MCVCFKVLSKYQERVIQNQSHILPATGQGCSAILVWPEDTRSEGREGQAPSDLYRNREHLVTLTAI